MSKNFLNSNLLKFILILLFLFLFFGGLYIGKGLLKPLSFAALFAMLLLPVARKLEKWGLARGVANIFSILILIIVVSTVVFLLSTQVAGFAQDLPDIRDKISTKIENLQTFIHKKTGVAPDTQLTFAKQRLSGLIETGSRYAQNFLVGITGAVATFSIILIYIFFFLYYRTRFTNFILRVSPGHDAKTWNIISQVSHVTQSYLSGVLIVIFLLAIMNTTGLLIIGLKHAVFFGILAAILNIIPYIGVFIGGLLPVTYALISHDSTGVAVATAAVFVASQFIENNFLTPMIVGSKVKVNPLATIIALLIGGSIWGVAGMILFIPFLGVAKIIFDNVEDLKPFGYLIGEDESEGPTFWEKMKKKIFHKGETS